MFELLLSAGGFVATLIGIGIFVMIIKMYRKVDQGQALVRNGMGGPKVTFSGMLVIPIFHLSELMDISLKRVEIKRSGKDGLICKDNIRADIEVVFFVRVNKTEEEVLKVAQSIGCVRASDLETLVSLFDAKFSEGLKTVGKRFEFEELYNSRERFKAELLEVIGTDLNGYILDDAAIDYLEQTALESLNPNNILDSQGIEKITRITATQKILANQIEQNRAKTITQQNVDAQEAILEMNRHLAESTEKQKREVGSIKAREESATAKVQQEERWKSEQARIQTEEEIAVATQNKDRQIIVAAKSKERTEGVETERVAKDRMLEATERERVVTLAQIEKQRAVEEENKRIQEVIRERVIVEKATVEEEEKIKNVRAFAEADRQKQVAVTGAAREAEQKKITVVLAAEAEKEAAKFRAEQTIIAAEAEQNSAERKAAAIRTLADARIKDEAVKGMSEAQVIDAKATALEKQGTAEANVQEKKALAEAHGLEAKAVATEKQGTADANVMAKKFQAEALGIEQKSTAEARGMEANASAIEKQGLAEATVMARKYEAEAQGVAQKADAMRKLDGPGKEHEEFKLRLAVEKDVTLAQIHAQQEIADFTAHTMAEGLKAAKIDIVGGDTMFFDRIISAVTQGKSLDRLVHSSEVLRDVKHAFFNDPDAFAHKLREYVDKFGLTSEDLKNLTISALLAQLIGKAGEGDTKHLLSEMRDFVLLKGWGDKPAGSLAR